jgi:hypothetical protein
MVVAGIAELLRPQLSFALPIAVVVRDPTWQVVRMPFEELENRVSVLFFRFSLLPYPTHFPFLNGIKIVATIESRETRWR